MNIIQDRLCLDCKETKPITEFSINNHRRDGLCIYCKSCSHIRRINYYDRFKEKEVAKHKEYCKKNWKRIRDKNRQNRNKKRLDKKSELVKLHGGKCVVCGYNRHISAFDFHHKDPKTKTFTLGSVRQFPLDILIEESKKCALLCANCHRELHAGFITLPE